MDADKISREKHKTAQREWLERNPDYSREYREGTRERRTEYQRLWRSRHPGYALAHAKATYHRYIDLYRAKGRRRNAALKLNVITYYSQDKLVCAKCNENRMDCLSIDHINGLGTQNRKALHRSGSTFYQWLKSNGHPDGFQVLCMNCQFIKKKRMHEV